MQFKVPQFLEIEDKIFGPFTFREFAYLAGGAGFSFIIYKLLGFMWGAIPILLIAGFSLMLTFYRPNGKPFMSMLEAGLKYSTQHKLYIWKKDKKINQKDKQALSKDQEQIKMMGENRSKLNGSRLRDLAWSLDILELSKNKNKL